MGKLLRALAGALIVAAAFRTAYAAGADCTGAPTGYFEGTATSREAGALQVQLNLRCENGRYAGELTTPVGTFDIVSVSMEGRHATVSFAAGAGKGTLEFDVAGDRVRGRFVMGDDSGPFELSRSGEARQRGFDRPTLALTPAQWREDLHVFATEVPRQHANAFAHLSHEAFDRQVAEADTVLQHANGDEAYLAIDKIANAIGDGHTFVMWPDDFAHVPLEIGLFGHDYRVTGVLPGNERALGARIVKVGDIPIGETIRRLRSVTPAAETKVLGDIRMEDFLAIGMILHATGVIPDRNSVRYTLVRDHGAPFEITLQGMTQNDFANVKWVRPFTDQPLYLQNHDEGLWCTFLDSRKTLYCSFRGYDRLAENAQEMLAAVRRDRPRKVVVDMRFNLGGDYTLGEKYVIEPLRALPQINRRGHLFVLISAYTFSAGMSNAAQFRSRTHAILAGQTIGERPNSYQEPREIRLPNSHLIVRVSTRYYHFGGGDNVIRPDRKIPVTWRGYANGRDPVLDWVLNSGG